MSEPLHTAGSDRTPHTHGGTDAPECTPYGSKCQPTQNHAGSVGTGAGEGAPRQDTGSAWVTRSADCPEAPAQAHGPRVTPPTPPITTDPEGA